MKTRPIDAVFFDLGDTLVDSRRGWIPGARSVIDDLHARHVRIGVISDTGNLARDQLAGRLPPDFDWAAFEAGLVILSSEVGVAKPTPQEPSPEIFRKTAARGGLDAGACLFCTEDPGHTLAAQSIGMVAARILKPPGSDLRALFDLLLGGGSVLELRGSAGR